MGCLQSRSFIWPLTGCSCESKPLVVLDKRGWSGLHLGNHPLLVPSFPHLSFSVPNKGAACLPLPQGLPSEEPRSKLCISKQVVQSHLSWFFNLRHYQLTFFMKDEDLVVLNFHSPPNTFFSPYSLYPWRRKWRPTPVFMPGESHGLRSLAGYSPWGHRVGHDWATKPIPSTGFLGGSGVKKVACY